MNSVFDFIVKPFSERNNNKVELNGSELILNTEMQNHQYVSRHGVVISTPLAYCSEIKPGDEVIVHHNVFRRFYDVRGKEKNSRSYFREDLFFVQQNQVYAYKRNEQWRAVKGFSFIKPLQQIDTMQLSNEIVGKGVVKHSDGYIEKGALVSFKPGSEYEFFIENERLYRVPNKFITIKYEYKGNEEEYNPSWSQSS